MRTEEIHRTKRLKVWIETELYDTITDEHQELCSVYKLIETADVLEAANAISNATGIEPQRIIRELEEEVSAWS